jgi:hypothetical protein
MACGGTALAFLTDDYDNCRPNYATLEHGLFIINPYEAEATLKVLKNSVRTSKRTPHFTITKIK